jgi:2-polyprenyl-3-methyl-5-hydroxy-6-metoxy-1,4-benzoquinol methylase
MIKKAKRIHDSIYLVRPGSKVKESFKFIVKLIFEFKKKKKSILSIADIGCANGQLPWYLSKKFPSDKIIGLEYRDDLVKAAKKYFPEIQYFQGSVLDRKLLKKHSLDVITLCGVLQIFDDYKKVINNLIYWAKPDSKILIHGLFNPYDADVFISYKRSNSKKINFYESGWNIFSVNSINEYLKKNSRIKKHTFHKFEPSIQIKKRNNDHLRSWTQTNNNGEIFFTNGLCLIQYQYILEITVN